jgi:hypothetical protein
MIFYQDTQSGSRIETFGRADTTYRYAISSCSINVNAGSVCAKLPRHECSCGISAQVEREWSGDGELYPLNFQRVEFSNENFLRPFSWLSSIAFITLDFIIYICRCCGSYNEEFTEFTREVKAREKVIF